MRKFRTAAARRAFTHYNGIGVVVLLVVALLVVALLPSAAAVRQAVIPPLTQSRTARRQLMGDRPPDAPIAPVAPVAPAPVAPAPVAPAPVAPAPVAPTAPVTLAPIVAATLAPSQTPVTSSPVTLAPTFLPKTAAPTAIPTSGPTFIPTLTPQPTSSPSLSPSTSKRPTNFPTSSPTDLPSSQPSVSPSNSPTISMAPSNYPTNTPSSSLAPSSIPSIDLNSKDDRALSGFLLSVVVPKRDSSSNGGLGLRGRSLLSINQIEWENITYHHVSTNLEKALSTMNTPFVFFYLYFEGPYQTYDEELSVTFSQLVTAVAYFVPSKNTPTANQLDQIVLSAFEGTSMLEYLLLLENARDPVLRTTQKVHLEEAPNDEYTNNNGGIGVGRIILYCGISAGLVAIIVVAYFVHASRKDRATNIELEGKNTSDDTYSNEKPVSFPDASASDEQSMPPPESARSASEDDSNSLVGSTCSYNEKNSMASSTVVDLYGNIEKRNETYDDMMTGGDGSVLGSLNAGITADSPARDESSGTSLSKMGDPTNTSFSEIWKDRTDEESAASPPSTQKKANVRSSPAHDTHNWEAKYGIPQVDSTDDILAQQSALTDSMWTSKDKDAPHERLLDDDAGVPTSIFAPTSVQRSSNNEDEIGWEDKYGIPKKYDEDYDFLADLSVSQGFDKSVAAEADAFGASHSLTYIEDNEQTEEVFGDDLSTTLDSEKFPMEILQEDEEEYQGSSSSDEVLEPKSLDDSMQEQQLIQLQEIPDDDEEEESEEGPAPLFVVEPKQPVQDVAAAEAAPLVEDNDIPVVREELEHDLSIDSDLYGGGDEGDAFIEERKDEMSI